MKTNIHPTYAPVVFRDVTTGDAFLTRSTAQSASTIEWSDGNVYPLVETETSSYSHPAYTGAKTTKPRGGQMQKFMKRYGNA